jgi:serine protease AprX
MLEADPTLQPAQIKEILSRTATPLPRYFYHEVGAGMLNTYSAVVQAAFPERKMGLFRSTLSQNQIRFVTSTAQTFTAPVYPGSQTSVNIPLPENVVQAGVSVSWNLSPNDFGLKVYSPAGGLADQSNYLNLPGLTGRREKVVLRSPQSGTFRAGIAHTGGTGVMQNVYGVVEITRVEYPELIDLSTLSTADLTQAQISLLTNAVLPDGKRFRPTASVSRGDLAAAFVRAGLAPQYLAAQPMFLDVRDLTTRNAVESVQSVPGGKLFFDASPGGRFSPNDGVNRLAAAVAFVKAAGLQAQAAAATLPAGTADASSIPAEWRGYVAVALQNGFLARDGNYFNASRTLTRIELARAINALIAGN